MRVPYLITPELSEAIFRASLISPSRVTDISSWHGHVPFAFALVKLMEPKRIVELGTHKGDSYAAFCQGVETFELPTECFAIDSWEGDSQAGYYGSEIYEELKSFHDPKYSDFSTLLRMRFEDAVDRFEDHSIDLLHIDGLHTYDAVKTDYEMWLPKMSRRGVMLFHDSGVLDRPDFRVWQFWREIASTGPHFEFFHSNGLGVLCIGDDAPPLLEEFMNWCDQSPDEVRRYFSLLGAETEIAQASDIRAHRDELGSNLEYARSIVEERDQQLAERQGRLSSAEEQLATLAGAIREKDELIKAYQDNLDQFERNKAAEELLSHQRISALENSQGELQVLVASLRDTIKCLEAEVAQSRAALGQVRASRWWRLRNLFWRVMRKKKKLLLDTEL